MIRRSRTIVVALVVAALTCVGPAAFAAWNAAGDGNARSAATTMPTGNTPTAAVSNRNVQVTWSAVTMPGGIPVDGYRVFRYDMSGSASPATGGCAGVIATLTCTETSVAPGSWRYSIAPVYKSWQGAEGARSATVVVAAPALTLSDSTNITSVPATLNGTVNNYVPGQTLTVRLDDPVGGSILVATVTPNSTPAGGQANVQVTIPANVADGEHTLYAVGSGGDVASASFTVAVPAPSPTSFSTTNGGGGSGNNKIGSGDTMSIGFSSPLMVASLCSTWSGDGSNQTAAGKIVVDDDAVSGNDRLRVTTTAPVCGSAFRFGEVNLGNNGFVAADTTFDATISWNAASSQLTVSILTDSGSAKKVNSTNTATYSPDGALTGTNGRTVVGTVSDTAMHF